MPVDVFATSPHYVHHLRPVWDALPEPYRGDWYGEPHRPILPSTDHDRPIVVASFGDLRDARNAGRKRIIMAQHGCGMSYSNDHPAYAGGRRREGVVLLLNPNGYAHDRDRAAHPHIPSVIIGCPKLDPWWDAPTPAHRRRTVCVSFHWPGGHNPPETRWAFPYYRAALKSLKKHADKHGYVVIGHGHPRAQPRFLFPFWDECGFDKWSNFRSVMIGADLYVCDNSSTMYEFAALDRPVLTLNSPTYRRDINHGIRFWEAIPGLQADDGGELPTRILETLEDPAEARVLRRAAVDAVYPVGRGNAAQLAADAIMGV